MDRFADNHKLTSIEQLEHLYGKPAPLSLAKELNYISDHYRAFMEKAPFLVIASVGPEGMDCSPRGDPPGFVHVIDQHTILIPDRRGNNRLDTLRNIINDSRISLLFLIPGIGNTIRVNGTAELTTDPEVCRLFEIQGKLPKSVIKVTAERVYFQCQKALARSRLWQENAKVDPSELPTAGQMSEALSIDSFDGDAYDRDYPERMKETIY